MAEWLTWIVRLGVAAYEAVRQGQDPGEVAQRLSDEVRIGGQRKLARVKFDAARGQ